MTVGYSGSIRPRSRSSPRSRRNPGAAELIFVDGFLWVTNPGHQGRTNGAVTKIDPATNTARSATTIGAGPWSIAAAGGYLWIGFVGETTVVQLSTATGAVVHRVTVADNVTDIAARGNSVWVLHNPTPVEGQDPGAGSVTHLTF